MPVAVTYCRVSSEEQAQKDTSIPAQRKALERWVQAQEDLIVVQHFEDQGESAYAPADRRPGFCAMVAWCQRNPVDFILVHKLDRFSRNLEESVIFKSLLRKHRVTVRSITEPFDPETPAGFLFEGMVGVINQFYSMNLGTEVLKGMREGAERGQYVGGVVPFGYRVATVQGSRGRAVHKLVPGPDNEVEAVRTIFQLAGEQGLGLRSICIALNASGLPAPRGGRWASSTAHFILRNRVYTGDLVWGKSRRSGRTRRVPNSQDQVVLVKDAHPALVGRDLFDACQRALDQRPFLFAPEHAATRRTHLLTGLMRCQNCGRGFSGRVQRTTTKAGEVRTVHRYYCTTYLNEGRAACHTRPVLMPWLDRQVLDALRDKLTSPQALEALRRRVRERLDATRKHACAEGASARRRLATIESKIANYYRAIGDGLDPAVCKQLIAELEVKKAELVEEANSARTFDDHEAATRIGLDEVERLAEVFDDVIDDLPHELRRQLVEHFVVRIDVEPDQDVKVVLRLPSDADKLRWFNTALRAQKAKKARAPFTFGPTWPGVHRREEPRSSSS